MKLYRREVEIFEHLKSPFITTFVGASCPPQKTICILTEFIPLGSVLTAMNKRKFSAQLKAKCLLDTARGVWYIHTCGIMHRDLKPDNIMLYSWSPDTPVTCKITDFGTARTLGSMEKCEITGGVGSPAYMAPEVTKITHDYDMSCDTFSFAMTMWFFYAEEEPYNPQKFPEFTATWKISEYVGKGNRLPSPEKIPPAMDKLMKSCWEQIPQRRPQFSRIVEYLFQFYNKLLTKMGKKEIAEHAPPEVNPELHKALVRIAQEESQEQFAPK